MKRLALTALAAFALVSFPTQAQAQTYVGPVAAFHGDFDFGVGGYASFGMPSIHENVAILVDGEFFFPGNDITAWMIAGGMAMTFPLEDQAISPFAFGQLAYRDFSFPGDEFLGAFGVGTGGMALHLGGGVSFGGADGGMRPSVGGRVELGSGGGFAVFGALGFPVGGS